MDSEYILTANGKLYHSGIKGMKWGVRRYQNKDGSLTPAGKKRYAQEEARLKERERAIKGREKTNAKLAKLNAKKAELDAREKALAEGKKLDKEDNRNDSKTTQTKTAKDMTDDELRESTNRLNLEKNYKEALIAARGEVKVSKGRKFLNTFSDKLVDSIAEKAANSVADLGAQTLKSVGAKYINDFLSKQFEGAAEKVHTNNKK